MAYVIILKEQDNCVNLIPDIWNHTNHMNQDSSVGNNFFVLFQVLFYSKFFLWGMVPPWYIKI